MDDGPATRDGRVAAEGDRAELFDEPLISRLAGDRRHRDRDWLTDLIQQHLNDEECRIVLLTGAPGTGKSTIMGQLAERHGEWPRYFIRRAGERDNDARSHEGGVTSFLTQIGFQLLKLRGEELFPQSDTQLQAELDVHEVGRDADVAVIRVAEWFSNPFQQQAVRAKLKAFRVQGRATVVEIGRLVTDAGMAPMELENAALGEPLQRLAAKHPGERVVVLLDGLDEVRFRDGTTDVARWLTGHQQFPSNLRIVVASRPDNPLLSGLRIGHEASVREVLITADEHSAHVAQDVDGYLGSLADEAEVSSVLTRHGLTSQRFAREAGPKVGGNFLYLEMIARLLDAEAASLRPGSATMLPAPDLDWLDRLETLPDKLQDFYALLLLNLHSTVGGTPATRSQWEDLYRPLLGLLAVTMTPLTSRQMRAFGEIAQDQGAVDGALERLTFFLDRDQETLDGDQGARFRLHHTAMADFLTGTGVSGTRRDPLLYCDPNAWHGRITDHSVWLHKAAGTWRDADPYLRRRLPFHAAEAGRLDDLVEDPLYLIAADPDALVPEFSAIDRAKPITLVYQQIVPMVRDGNVDSAMAHLKLYAEQQGLAGFAAAIPMDRESNPFLLDFTRWEDVHLRQVLGRHDGEVTGVAVTRGRDRRPLAVTGGHDGKIRTWDLLTGREAEESRVSAGTWITALAAGELDSGDAIAVSGDLHGAVRVWDLASGLPIGGPMIGHENAGHAMAAAYTASGPQVVCRIGDESRAWDLAALAPAHPSFLPADVRWDEPMAAAGWGGGTVLAATLQREGDRGRARVWDTAAAVPLGPVIEAVPAWITAIALAEVNETLLVAIADIELGLQVFAAATGQPWAERRVYFESPMAGALAMGTVNGQAVLAVGDDYGQIQFRELPSLRRLGDPVQAHAGRITALAFGTPATGSWVASTGRESVTEDGQRQASARFWVPGIAGGKKPACRLAQAAAPIPLPEPAERIVLGGDGGRLEAITLNGRQATRWDIAGGRPVGKPFGGRNDRVCAVGVATVAGRTVAVSATYDTGTIRTWDIPDCTPAVHPATGQPLIRQDAKTVRDLAVTRLGGRPVAVCAGWGDIRVWDAATGEPAGTGLISGPKNLQSLSVGELAGRPIVAYAAGSPSEDRLTVLDLETGTPLGPPRRGASPSPAAVAVTGHAGRTLVVSGGSYLSLSAWDPASDADPAVIQVAGETSVLAATFVRGDPVAICSGRMGEVRLVDLAADAATGAGQRPVGGQIWPVKGLAITEIPGQRVVVCAHDHGVRVLDLVTGEDAAAQPAVRSGSLAVATGTLHGRPVAVAGGYPNHAWYLDTGEPLANQPGWPDIAHSVAVASMAGRVIAVAGTWSDGIVVADLETGRLIGDPVDMPGGPVRDVGVATVAGRPVVIARTDMGILARYLDLPWLPPRKAGISYREFTAQEETPPPPELFPAKRLTRHPHGNGWCMALGAIEGQPIVISGHDRGDIDIFEATSGLPLQPSLGGGESNIAAIACQRLGGREVMAFGALDGTVAVADLTDLSVQTAIRTHATVWAIALAEPDHCVIGTEKGLIAIRLPFSPRTGQAGGARRVRLPVDIRAARACQEHDKQLHPAEKDGHLGRRLCLKGVQQGGIRKADSLSYPGGHCYLLPDRLEIVAAGSAGGTAVPPLVIDLRSHLAEPVDDWEAYLTNGCHFGVGVDSGGRYVVLACYRRSERDWLLAEMRKRLGRR
jgi:WD40 repeat protein